MYKAYGSGFGELNYLIKIRLKYRAWGLYGRSLGLGALVVYHLASE